MITLENRFFPIRSAVCFLIDAGIIILSVIGSFLILDRIGLVEKLGLFDLVIRGVAVAFFCQTCMYMLDLYDFKLSYTWVELFFSVVFAVGFFCLGIGVVSYAIPAMVEGGNIYYPTIFLVTVLLMIWRIAFYYYIHKYAPPHNILIIGADKVATLVAEEIDLRKRLGFKLVGVISLEGQQDAGSEKPLNVLGGFSQIDDIARRYRVQEVVVAMEKRRGKYPVREMLDLRVRGWRITEWQPFFEKLSGYIPIDNLAPSFFIFSEGFRKSLFVHWMRRAISFLAALIGLVVLSPFFIVISLLIRMDSPGPVFFTQRRVGLNGTVFRLIKFRSMAQDSEKETGPRWATENDPRITRVGKWLRIYRIDEFPQLVNILKGDIDLVGPRPERPEFVEKLKEAIPYYALRHTIRPGITGWAQVMFPYGGTVEESKEKLQYDLYYVKNMSIKLDLLIMIRTVKILILGRGSR